MSKTIALVDDDRNILTSLSIALEREGFKVQTYIDEESALVLLRNKSGRQLIIQFNREKHQDTVSDQHQDCFFDQMRYHK